MKTNCIPSLLFKEHLFLSFFHFCSKSAINFLLFIVFYWTVLQPTTTNKPPKTIHTTKDNPIPHMKYHNDPKQPITTKKFPTITQNNSFLHRNIPNSPQSPITINKPSTTTHNNQEKYHNHFQAPRKVPLWLTITNTKKNILVTKNYSLTPKKSLNHPLPSINHPKQPTTTHCNPEKSHKLLPPINITQPKNWQTLLRAAEMAEIDDLRELILWRENLSVWNSKNCQYAYQMIRWYYEIVITNLLLI